MGVKKRRELLFALKNFIANTVLFVSDIAVITTLYSP